jgi:hypothetical protein
MSCNFFPLEDGDGLLICVESLWFGNAEKKSFAESSTDAAPPNTAADAWSAIQKI